MTSVSITVRIPVPASVVGIIELIVRSLNQPLHIHPPNNLLTRPRPFLTLQSPLTLLFAQSSKTVLTSTSLGALISDLPEDLFIRGKEQVANFITGSPSSLELIPLFRTVIFFDIISLIISLVM